MLSSNKEIIYVLNKSFFEFLACTKITKLSKYDYFGSNKNLSIKFRKR